MSIFLRYYHELLDRWAELEIAKGVDFEGKTLNCDPITVNRLALNFDKDEIPDDVTVASKTGQLIAVTAENIEGIKDAVAARANAIYSVRDNAKAAIAAATTKAEVESIVIGIVGTL